MNSQNIKLLKKMIGAIRDDVNEDECKRLDKLEQTLDMIEFMKMMNTEKEPAQASSGVGYNN